MHSITYSEVVLKPIHLTSVLNYRILLHLYQTVHIYLTHVATLMCVEVAVESEQSEVVQSLNA